MRFWKKSGPLLGAAFLFALALCATLPATAQQTQIIGGRLYDESRVPHPAAGDPQYGIAFKRPVLQASCRYCPWGAVADAVKKAMAPYGYDVAICYSCSGGVAVRLVAKKLVATDLNDRDHGEGTLTRPEARIDFGVTGLNSVRDAYDGVGGFQRDGPYKNLRAIARINDEPSYLMIAATKQSGITDLGQSLAKRMPLRIMGGAGGTADQVLDYYGVTRKDLESWGGKILDGNALDKDPNFDVMIGIGALASNPENSMWYEMTQRKDLVFLPIPEGLRDRMVKTGHMVKVDLPFRYLRGVGDKPIPTVGDLEGLVVYGTADLPDGFVRDVAKALDEQRTQLRWTYIGSSYDSATVWDAGDVPLHPAAARYYRERGFMK